MQMNNSSTISNVSYRQYYGSTKIYCAIISLVLVGLLYFQVVSLDVGSFTTFKISPLFGFGFVGNWSSAQPTTTTIDDEYDNETKYILDWTSFFGKPMTDERTWMSDCADFNCKMIADKSKLEQSQAVIFHMRNMDWNNLPPVRSSDQYYVFYLMESPYHSSIDPQRSENFFNLTISYRTDSDFFSPYGDFRKISNVSNDTRIMDEIEKLALNKTKMVAWFVSNCGTPSKRELLVIEMKKYIEIHTFGGCGQHQCPSTMSCNDMLKYDYKFYLSFENSMCKDYVTEKLFDRMNSFVLPVVLNRTFYKDRLPEHSVVSASDFRNVKELTDYLNYLNQNMTAYLEYFQWRKKYRVIPTYGICSDRNNCAFCGLCRFLHRKNKPKKIKKDVHKWWYIESGCDSTLVPKLLGG